MKRNPLPEIYVDVHEDDSGLANRLAEMDIGKVEIMSMETGDVVIRHGGYDIGIEIKREQDYSNSLHTGRLSDQVYRLMQTYSFPMLIVEGWHPYVGDDTTEDDVRKAVEMHRKSIRTFNRRVATYETKDMDDTLELLESIIKDISSDRFRYIRRPVILEESPDPQIVMLCSLPNVSVARATEILDLFGSPENAFTHVNDWIDVKGITQDRVDKIKEVWGNER